MTAQALDMLLRAHDQPLRQRARRLDPEEGEDAYHDVLAAILANPYRLIRMPERYIAKAMRLRLWKRRATAITHAEQSWRALEGFAPAGLAALELGRQRQTHCRRGHLFTEENLTYVGAQRTCLTCYRRRRREYMRDWRAQRKAS